MTLYPDPIKLKKYPILSQILTPFCPKIKGSIQGFVSFSFALIISAQALTKSETKLNLMNFSFANKWGEYTYGIYLLDHMAITTVRILFKSLHISETNFVNSFCYCIIGFILTMVFSKFSFKYFEYRFLILKSKFIEAKSGPVDFNIENV
jgi:peptidoglycan/LPS O-acetylase OafA/YrhL